MKIILLTLLPLLFLSHSLANAQNSSTAKDTVYHLPPVVVVGRAVVDEVIIRDNGSTVTRVTESQIDDLNAMDLPSTLRRVPGVSISRYNLVGNYGGGEGGTIYIRGQGTERPGASIQTIVDGVPMFVGIWTHPIMDLHSVSRLERVDVYKSPQPVLWGNMSIGAVNLVSKRMYSDGYKTSIKAIGGQNNTYNLAFNHGGKIDRFDYYFGAALQASDGHRPQSDGELNNYWGRIGYQFNDNWNISLISSYSDNWARDPGMAGSEPPKRARFNSDSFTLNMALSNQFENSDGFIRLYMDDGKIRWDQWSDDTDNWFNSNTDWLNSGVRIQQNFYLTTLTKLTVGLDYDSYGGEFTELHANPANTKSMPPKYFINTAGYASIKHDFPIGNGLTLSPSAGVRFNHHNVFSNETAPELGLTLSGSKWQLYGNYARGFNYAGVYSVWFYNVTWNYSDPQYEDLGPELTNHYEMGLKLNPVDKLSIDFSVYHDKGTDRIRLVPPPPPPPMFANIATYKITGFETTVNWSPIQRLAIFGGLTLIDKNPSTIPYTPDYNFSLGFNAGLIDRLTLSMDIEAIGERLISSPRFSNLSEVDENALAKTDSYVIANAKLSYYFKSFGFSGRGSNVFIAVDNLTDTDYEYRPGYPMPGATVFGGVQLEY